LLEELDGLAEGAGISRADALAVNIRGALTRVGDEGCTTYVIGSRGTADGEILIGQNADTFAEIIDFAYVLHLEPTGKPEVLIWTFGGMIGYHGINSAGVGQFAADLGTGGPQPRFGLPHYPVKRMMLECTRLDEISALLGQVPLGANGSYVLCDGRRKILNIEATTAGPVTVGDDGAGFIAHSNHFVGDRYATPANHQRCMPDSFTRLERMNGLLRDRYGEITVGDVQRFLGDRENDPTAICRRRTDEVGQGIETAGQTVASIIAEPARRRMHVALGNAADRVFVSYGMDS
jgi:isopenicillin-N N-acyltransferase-like protein